MVCRSVAFINANVITLNPARPKVQAIAIKDGKIAEAGSNEEVLRFMTGETRIIDLNGKTVVPGLIDSHVHMLGLGQSLRQLDLRKVRSIKELQVELKRYAKDRPELRWIMGGNWDQERFSEKRYPNRWDLDAAVSERPVFLTRVCGHIGVVNSVALELASISKVKGPLRGKIERKKDTDKPTGIIKEDGLDLIWRIVPKPSLEEIKEACVIACKKAVEAGLTGVNWLVSSADEFQAIQNLHSEGRIPIRVYIGVPASFLKNLAELGFVTGFGDDMVKLGFVKVFVDGSLGGHTAALNEPYLDKPSTSGMLLCTQRKLNKILLQAHRAGLQIALHAIGDRAVNLALSAFEKTFEDSRNKMHRHRIEHCSVLNPMMIKRMKRLGLIASVQPHFVVSDFWVVDRLGKERARWVYPFKSLLRAGIVAAGGSDSPVEPIDPLLGLRAAVKGSDYNCEGVTAKEALKMYTINAAYACFDENKRGSIEVGKFADLTVLSDDLYIIPPEKIKDVSVEMVIINGKIAYEKT